MQEDNTSPALECREPSWAATHSADTQIPAPTLMISESRVRAFLRDLILAPELSYLIQQSGVLALKVVLDHRHVFKETLQKLCQSSPVTCLSSNA